MNCATVHCGAFVFLATLLMATCGIGADITLTGGSITLIVSSATAGSQPNAASDNQCWLFWTRDGVEPTQKITVLSDLVSSAFPLTVEATNVVLGTSAGEVSLTTVAQDVVTNIDTAPGGSGQLIYQASATVAQGTGVDAHTITYTITAQ